MARTCGLFAAAMILLAIVALYALRDPLACSIAQVTDPQRTCWWSIALADGWVQGVLPLAVVAALCALLAYASLAWRRSADA